MAFKTKTPKLAAAPGPSKAPPTAKEKEHAAKLPAMFEEPEPAAPPPPKPPVAKRLSQRADGSAEILLDSGKRIIIEAAEMKAIASLYKPVPVTE